MATKNISDRQVCEAYAHAHPTGSCALKVLRNMTGEPDKVCYRAMERAADRGYVQYGVSLRTGWITDKGEAVLIPGGEV